MKTFELELKVRDYELDVQGIVNNSVYQNYLEHTRHEFLLSNGISFADMSKQGIDAVVARIEIAYKNSLRSGDSFISKLSVAKEGPKYIFKQAIHRKSDNKLCVRASVTTVVVIDGVMVNSFDDFDKLIDNK